MRRRYSRRKIDKALRLAAADLLEPLVQAKLEEHFSSRLVRRAMRRMSRALLDEPHLVIVAELEPELEAGYLPYSDVIVVTTDLARDGTVDEIREAVLEESLHRCLCALGLDGEDRHHAIIEPTLRRARTV